MTLKTDYKDDKFAGRRKYNLIQNEDSTISLDDVTQYQEEGDVFSAHDINITNQTINELDVGIGDRFDSVENEISSLETRTNSKISALQSSVNTEINALKNSDIAINNKITDNSNKIQSFKGETVLSFPASGWSSSSPYTQTVTYSGVVSSDTPIYGLRLTGTLNSANVEAQKLAWGYVDRIASGNGSVTAYCYTKKPTTNITLSGKLVK